MNCHSNAAALIHHCICLVIQPKKSPAPTKSKTVLEENHPEEEEEEEGEEEDISDDPAAIRARYI